MRAAVDCAKGRCAGKCPGSSEVPCTLCRSRRVCRVCAWCAWEWAAPKPTLGSLSLAGRGQNVGCVTERGVDAQTGAWIWGDSGWGRRYLIGWAGGMEGVCFAGAFVCMCVCGSGAGLGCVCVLYASWMRVWV